jgi:trigger factor
MTVELEQERMERAKKRAARQLSKRGKIAGFRPGKAPYDVVRRQYGDEAIIEAALDILLDEVYPEALEQADLKPAAAGSLEKMESIDPPKFLFTVPLMPEVDLGDYRKIRVPYKYKKPGKAEVDAKLEELQKMYATLDQVDRPIQDGDYIKADIIGKKVGAKGDDAIVYQEENHPVFVTTKSREAEQPFTGFAKKLIGMSNGETKTVSKKFPQDHADENLRGETVKYKVTVNSVYGTTYPEVDDDFVKKLGAGETVEDLRNFLEQDLEAESRSEYDDEYFTEVIEKIKKSATIKYPPQVLEHEIEDVLEDIKQRLAQQNMEFDAYLKMQEKTLEEFTEEEVRPVAIKRLERSLIFDEIARAEKVGFDEKQLEEEFNRTVEDLARQGYDLNQVKGGKRAEKDIANRIAQQSAAQLITRLTLDKIKEIATGELAKAEKAAKKAAEEAEKAKAAEEAKEEAEKNEKAEENNTAETAE